jgi:hypothetical protein
MKKGKKQSKSCKIKNNYCFRLWHITDSIFQHLDAVSLLRCEKVRCFPEMFKFIPEKAKDP